MIANIIIITLLNLITSGFSSAPAVKVSKVNYTVTEKSSLTIAGSSNVNKFSCTTYDNLSSGVIYIEAEDGGDYVKFNNAVLSINIKSFDCRNPMLNKDFYNTLNAKETPTIDIQLLTATPLTRGRILNANSGKFNADVAISLNGTSKPEQIIVSWQKVGNNLYRFQGEKKLHMTDFDIEAPVAALGLIKVNNDINIQFDLYVKASQKVL